MTTFDAPGARLALELSDEGGVPVVQLHGLTSSRARDRVLDLDLGRGLSGTRLLRFDARGHGASTGRTVPEDYRWDHLAQDLLALLDAVFPGEAVHGVGPSMGCATLLHAAVRAPERFRGLTLMAPPTAWETRAAKADEYVRTATQVELHGADFLRRVQAQAPVPPATEGTPDSMPDVPGDLLPSVLRGAAASDLPSPQQLAALRIPTTILAWSEDPAHPLSTAQALAALWPGTELQVARTRVDVERWPARLAADVARSA